MKNTALIAALLIVFVGTTVPVGAQYAAPPPAPYGQYLDGPQLDQLLGPIALYPDPLIAEILPATTQPSQIALAYNYISQGGDQNAIDQQPWDSSVKALAQYPGVLKMLGDDLSWTAELGQAFVNQPTDVMDSIQRLRAQAQNLGNLETTPQETVLNDDGEIEIVPAQPDLIYVPIYDPGIIFWQRPYGRRFCTFGVGFHIGPWFNHDFDWHEHHIVEWGRDHPRPTGWWHEQPDRRREDVRRGEVWHPSERAQRHPVVVNRGDRGFEPRVKPSTPVRENRPATPPHEVRPAESPRETRPAQPPREVHPPAETPREVRPVTPTRPAEPPREVRPTAPVHPAEPPREVRPVQPIRPVAPTPAPRPAPAPVAPSRPPPVSAFSGGSSAQTRAASSRGAESRGGGGGGQSSNKKH